MQLFRKFADAVEIENPPEGAILCWVVPVEAQKCKLARSKPVELSTGEIVYWITVVSDKPANSLTMHGELWLVPGAGIGDNDE